ncbi:MAG: hypothetical protein FD135_4348, partial [Comamonadaceae bacterium]
MRRINIGLAYDKKCPEHGTLGILPCAWPGCRNGLDDHEFEEKSLIEGSKPRIWKRREWKSPLGGQYYSWEGNELPNWFHAPQTFWNEARRLQLVPASYPDTIYHYTSIEGFLGIVRTRSVWMTDFSYLNDRREVRYGLDLLLEVVNAMHSTATRGDVQCLLSAWRDKLAASSNRVCITSFSGEDDSLSQWRAYGPIAIGFPVHPLALHVDQGRLQPVEYELATQKKLVQIYVQHLVSAFEADMDENRLDRISDVYHKSDRLLELAVFFKDPAFRSENEYRLVYIDYPDVLNSFGVESPPRSFRVARGRIVPYVPSTEVLKSEHRSFPLEISEVVLGPESDELLEQGVREFLHENGLPDVEVR